MDATAAVRAAATTSRRAGRKRHELCTEWRWWWLRRWRWRRSAPSVLPTAQDLPVLRLQRTEDRLQGRAAAAALYFRAWQDRAEPHHRGVRAQAARARTGDQALTLSRPAAIRDQV